MHWNHSVHFAQWGSIELLEKSLPWYKEILPIDRKTAQQQGYGGALWPKMVGPEGRQSPSFISPLIVWQQPHPIYLAELCYREHKDRETLDTYKELYFESAEFMASYVVWEKDVGADDEGRYVLGPR